jgi:hypothetical protein
MRKYLRYEEVQALIGPIGIAIEARREEWGIHGWSIRGGNDRYRISVRVLSIQKYPDAPIRRITIEHEGRVLHVKPRIEASHHGIEGDGQEDEPGAGVHAAGVRGLAPGAPLLFADDHGVQVGGFAAVLQIEGGLFVLTCGHQGAQPGAVLRLADNATEIASFFTNLLFWDSPVDAALYRLNPTGVRLMEQAADSPTWCKSLMRPVPSHIGHHAEFWPTHLGATGSFVETILSTLGSERRLFSSPAHEGFVQLTACTRFGDSGSLLTFRDSGYALCSGRIGRYSFFTPIMSVFERLYLEGIEAQPWTPGK